MTPEYYPLETYCAYHEAGHAVAQVILRWRPEAGDATAFRSCAGERVGASSVLNFNGFPAPANPAAQESGVHRMILVLYAGSAAGRRWALDNCQEVDNPGDALDRAMAAALPAVARENEIAVDDEVLPRLERRIAALFRRPRVWDAVKLTAEVLLEHRKLQGDLLTCHVKLTLGRRLTKREAALLASVRKS